MTIKIGSARHDENGAYTGGAAGDQTGTEVSTQTFYVHSKGWYVLRPKKKTHATKIAAKMKAACSNSHIGYDQGNRLGIVKYGIATDTDTECDCSSLVRVCVFEATGTDPGNFTTANEATVLAATGLFEEVFDYVSQSKTPLYNGDILVTKTKGHTAIVVSGNARSSSTSASASTTTTTKTATAPTYKTGKTYTVQVDALNVRKGAGTSYSVKTKAQLTADGQKNSNAKGQLNKGTVVTCKAVEEKSNGAVWLKIPSGYICAVTSGGKVYVG